MEDDRERSRQRYEILKQRLWNQPRALKFLERLERHHGRPLLLEAAARLFVSVQWGDAEIQAGLYYDLLRHRDRPDLLNRIADLRVIVSQLHQDLLFLANELHSIKDRNACGLSNRVISALIALAEDPPTGLELLLQRLAGEYQKRSGTHFHKTEGREGGELATIVELKRKADLRQVLSRMHRNFICLIRELYRLKHLKAHQTAGYAHFFEFAKEEIGLSARAAGGLVMVRKQIYRIDPDTLLQILIKGCFGPNQGGGQ